ncbi:unnamed protein product [Ceratitis capitata]|uniref:(Mediterranean fruit fly) hypothetical protein n=1 Tax=Ceratitis capitata TaxID=7213 RepID=A0A811UX01_CERCA|nr:unnamed protein product [Ceratitis capitata]
MKSKLKSPDISIALLSMAGMSAAFGGVNNGTTQVTTCSSCLKRSALDAASQALFQLQFSAKCLCFICAAIHPAPSHFLISMARQNLKQNQSLPLPRPLTNSLRSNAD